VPVLLLQSMMILTLRVPALNNVQLMAKMLAILPTITRFISFA
jgi:hypothetical protein